MSSQEETLVLARAQRREDAMAARLRACLLAVRECPADLVAWGEAHGIPEFAKFTWQAGFLAGMRAAKLEADAVDVAKDAL